MANTNLDSPILSMLYEAWSEAHQNETEGIQAAFGSLYESMNGMPMEDIDRVIYPVCTLCRNHEKEGFISGVRMGIQLAREVEGA